MNIRISTLSDIEEIVNQKILLWEYEKSIANFKIEIPSREEITREVNNFYNENKRVIVLEIDWKIEWFAYWCIEKSSNYIKDYEKTWYIDAIHVNEKYRGNWYWEKLIKEIISWLESQWIDFLQLWVLASNQWAIKLYEKYWFKTFYYRMKREK